MRRTGEPLPVRLTPAAEVHFWLLADHDGEVPGPGIWAGARHGEGAVTVMKPRLRGPLQGDGGEGGVTLGLRIAPDLHHRDPDRVVRLVVLPDGAVELGIPVGVRIHVPEEVGHGKGRLVGVELRDDGPELRLDPDEDGIGARLGTGG